MKINKLELHHFGKFEEACYELSPGVNILYGPNEAGKSTFREALKILLFGFGKAPQQYGYKSWNGLALKLRAELLADSGESFELERTLGRTVDGKVFRGLLSEPLGNGPLPNLEHLNRDLYSQIYALSTANTEVFQQLDWDGAVRKMLQSSGTNLMHLTDEVLQQLENEGNALIRLNGRGNYRLKTLESEGRELEERRRTLYKQREDLAEAIQREQGLQQQLKTKNQGRAVVKSDLTAMECFMETWMLMRMPKEGMTDSKDLPDYVNSMEAQALLDEGLALIERVAENTRIWETELRVFSQEWRALLGISLNIEESKAVEASTDLALLEALQWLSVERGEQAQILARQGRVAKAGDKGLGRSRILIGLAFLIGAVAVVLLAKENAAIGMYALAAAFGASGIFFTLEGLFTHLVGKKKLQSVEQALQVLFDSKLPVAAIETMDESYYERLKNLGRASGQLLERHTEVNAEKEKLKRTLLKLDDLCGCEKYHQPDCLYKIRELLVQSQREKEKRNQQSLLLEQSLAKAEAESGMTMESVLEKMGSYGTVSLPQTLEKLRALLEACDEEIRLLSQESSSLRKEIEIKSSLEELPRLESSILSNRDEVTQTKIKRDRLLVLESFIRLMDRKYAKSHQPELIQKASAYLGAISQGRYERIYMSDAKDEGATMEQKLQVDTHQGALSLSSLTSTGTREQFYMALKLATMSQMEDGRERLPVVLDEVFAHWDRERTEKCLNLLRQEATNRQMLILTCHRELAELAVQITDGRLIELT